MLLIWNLAVGGAWDNDCQQFTKWNANAHTHTHTHNHTNSHTRTYTITKIHLCDRQPSVKEKQR